MFPLRTLLFAMTILSADGWLFGGRRRTDIHKTTYVNRNNCHCVKVINNIIGRLDKIEKKIGIRDVAEILDVDEDYPGFEDFAAHLDTKRDGTIDKEELASVIKIASRATKMLNHCHCGRSVIDNFNMGL